MSTVATESIKAPQSSPKDKTTSTPKEIAKYIEKHVICGDERCSKVIAKSVGGNDFRVNFYYYKDSTCLVQEPSFIPGVHGSYFVRAERVGSSYDLTWIMDNGNKVALPQKDRPKE